MLDPLVRLFALLRRRVQVYPVRRHGLSAAPAQLWFLRLGCRLRSVNFVLSFSLSSSSEPGWYMILPGSGNGSRVAFSRKDTSAELVVGSAGFHIRYDLLFVL